jgi:hypothetical protein
MRSDPNCAGNGGCSSGTGTAAPLDGSAGAVIVNFSEDLSPLDTLAYQHHSTTLQVENGAREMKVAKIGS